MGEGDSPPISKGRITLSKEDIRSLKLLLLRALNNNQRIILLEISNNFTQTITSLLLEIEKKYGTPLSTLKLNARILKRLKLIDFGNSSSARLTRLGRIVLEIIRVHESER